jgi:superfamily II DNA helicase RecQ
MRAIMARESPVVAVMGTGGGKSLLFMLPAFCSDGGVSVVVVPLIALRQDMQKRCQQMGIVCREWNSRQPADAARVVLVTPESAVSEGFRTFLNRMRAT